MSNVVKLERLHIRIEPELKERFNAICDEKAINASALIRKWVEDFVEEHDQTEESLDVLDVVWRLNTEKSASIEAASIKAANRGFGSTEDIFSSITEQLISRAQETGSFAGDVDGAQCGRAKILGEEVYFRLENGKGTWSTEKPDWLNRVYFK
ncbi:MAG: hypothetical protein QM401_04200 [Bacillota bacterium]|nr:hypothetical protein [Bacillota bacterium]